jgi:hypothetical protein
MSQVFYRKTLPLRGCKEVFKENISEVFYGKTPAIFD